MDQKKLRYGGKSKKFLQGRLRKISENILRGVGSPSHQLLQNPCICIDRRRSRLTAPTVRLQNPFCNWCGGSKKTAGKKADIFLLSHEEMARLKKKFLPREEGPPNVLAFPEPKHWPCPEKKHALLGEIYLNRDLAKGDIDELARLLIHGILHLLGYDHKKKNDRIRMEKTEKYLNKKIGKSISDY